MGAAIRSCDYYDFIEEEITITPADTCIHDTYFFFTANIDGSLMSDKLLAIGATQNEQFMYPYAHRLEDAMRAILNYDLHDVPVMMGAAVFSGSVVGFCWGLASSSPAPTPVVLGAAILGALAGRLVSAKARAKK